ncbi:MAG TPA: hypothetical protein VGF73_12855 [Chthoniobacterales bacterium]
MRILLFHNKFDLIESVVFRLILIWQSPARSLACGHYAEAIGCIGSYYSALLGGWRFSAAAS